MKTAGFSLVLACFCFAVACTDAPVSALDVVLRFSPTPPSVGPTRLLFELTDSMRAPVAGASVRVEGRPTGEPRRPTTSTWAQESGDGRYVVDSYEFDVAGPWILAVRAQTTRGSELVREFETSVYGGPPGAGPGR